MTSSEILFDNSDQRLNRKRFVFVAGSLVIALIAATFFSGPGSNANSNSSKLKAAAAGKLSEPNPVRNPPYTFGPKCSMNVGIALDRSGSAVPYAGQLKNTLNGFYDLLHTRTKAIPTGGSAYVFLDAFGSYSIRQNGPPPGATEDEQWFYYSKYDIANDDNLEFQKNVVNEVWYNGAQATPYPPDRPDQAYKGYFGGSFTDWTPFRMSRAGSSGTNYDSALTSLAHQIGFWTGNDASKRGDQDFDMVLVVSDGVPTKSFGADHLPQYQENDLLDPNPFYPGPESWGNSADPNDLKYARQAVNTLRTGSAIKNEETGVPADVPFMGPRPPVPVIGILTGATADDAVAKENMNYIYGDNNWYGASNFTDELSAALEKAIEGVGCFGDEEAVTPELELTSSYSPSAEQNQNVDVTLTIKNKSSVPVSNLQWGVTQDVIDEPTWTALNLVTLGPAGSSTDSTTVTFSFNTGYDASEFQFYFTVFGIADIDSETQYCSSPEEKGSVAAASEPTPGSGPDYDDPCGTFSSADAYIAVRMIALPS